MYYPSRLNALALMSLEKRRLVQDLVLTYKIIFGLLDIDFRKFFFTLVVVVVVVEYLYSASRSASNALIVPQRCEEMSL